MKIERAHFVGLSMGAYSSLRVGLNAPHRAISLTLAGIGTGSEPARMAQFPRQRGAQRA
jgi:3-oxoadipate enol-lactonase